MKISVQSLFEDYEDDTVELRRDADTARILEKTMAKLPNARKKRPLRLVLIAAAAAAVLCGAAAIVHYASVEPAEQPYTLKSVFRDVDGTTIRQDIDFTQDGAVTFDTDGKTNGFLCGISQIPQTDDILDRAVNISIGVVDKGLGSGCGININSTEEEINATAKHIREVIAGL